MDSLSVSKKILKIFFIIYIVITLASIVIGILVFTPAKDPILKEFASSYTEDMSKSNISLETYAAILIFTGAVSTLIYAVLFKRALNDGNKSTFLLILLILSVSGGVVGIFTELKNGFNAMTIKSIVSSVINIIPLLAVLKVRKDAQDQ